MGYICIHSEHTYFRMSIRLFKRLKFRSLTLPSMGSPAVVDPFFRAFVVLSCELRALAGHPGAGARPSEWLVFASAGLPWEFTFTIPLLTSVCC